MKLCKKCLKSKDFIYFSKNAKNPDNLQGSCKECIKAKYNTNKVFRLAQIRSYRLANIEKEREASIQRYWKNREQRLENNKRNHILNKELWNKGRKYRYQENIEKEKETRRLWRLKNLEKDKKDKALWSKSNQDKRNAHEAKRRASKLKATPNWLTKEQLLEIEEFYTLCKELQWLSDPNDPLQVDHIMPLQGKNSCGLHVPWNLQILPRSLNIKKHNR
jgi:hypothetical protein